MTNKQIATMDKEARVMKLSECNNMLRAMAEIHLKYRKGPYRCMVGGKPVQVIEG